MKKKGLAILGIGAAAAAGVVAYKNRDKIKNKINEVKCKKDKAPKENKTEKRFSYSWYWCGCSGRCCCI